MDPLTMNPSSATVARSRLRELRVAPALAAALAIAGAADVHAIGTAAGTDIQNTATVTYSVSGTAASTTSNTTSVVVAEIVDVAIALQSPTATVTPGATGEALVFLVTNTGNGTEIFALAGDSVLVGDDFDPVPGAPFIYIDTDGSGDLSPADAPYVAGANDPVLDADASVRVIVANDVPATVVSGNRGRSALAATAATGSGAPGTAFAGQGTGGVDAVVGTSGGTATVFGEYLIDGVLVTAVKSQTVSDPLGGTRPVPGATIVYQIVVAAAGTGSATGAAFTDAIPASTTYVPGSLSLNGSALTDGIDADPGRFDAPPTPGVAVALGDLTAAAGPQTIVFHVTID
jgi:uncharacterized repeat protein (TIGR01451 family)